MKTYLVRAKTSTPVTLLVSTQTTPMLCQVSQPWQGWSLSSEMGFHFKKLDFPQDTPRLAWGHDPRFWGEAGGLWGTGLKFGKHWYWGCKLSWTFFYPDLRWTDKSDITLSSIPIIGKFIRIATNTVGYWSMILVPIILM